MATESLGWDRRGECNLLNFLDFQIIEIKLGPLRECIVGSVATWGIWVCKYCNIK